MSKIKQDLMKEIEAKVIKNKQLAQQSLKRKTIANWVADFFTEYDKLKTLEKEKLHGPFSSLALKRLHLQLQNLDNKCWIDFKQSENNNGPIVEIRWSKHFIKANNCEEILIFDAASAYFQSALEDVT